jgi:hypothetical protein
MYFLYMRATCLEHDQSKQDMAIFSPTFESFDLKKKYWYFSFQSFSDNDFIYVYIDDAIEIIETLDKPSVFERRKLR